MMKRKIIAAAIAAAAMAVSATAFASGTEDVLKAQLAKTFPDVKVDAVKELPGSGLYEVTAGRQVGYITKDGHYFVSGPAIELPSRKNITEARQNELSKIDYKALNPADAVVIKKGDGKVKFSVFSDPDCPYCRMLERELAKIDGAGYTEHVYLFPLESIHKNARDNAVSVWCSADKILAWTTLMLNDERPKHAECDNPVERNIKLGEKLGVAGTPTIYGEDGNVIPFQALVEMIKAGAKK